MTVFLLIGIALGKIRNVPIADYLQEKIHGLPNLVRSALALEPAIEKMVQNVKDKSIFYFAGYLFIYLRTLRVSFAFYLSLSFNFRNSSFEFRVLIF